MKVYSYYINLRGINKNTLQEKNVFFAAENTVSLAGQTSSVPGWVCGLI
jgi:hypothetical protein